MFAGSGYLPQCEGFVPPKGVYSHISGIDLVQAFALGSGVCQDYFIAGRRKKLL